MQAANMTDSEERQLMQSALGLGIAQRAELAACLTTENSVETFRKLHDLNTDIRILEQELARV